jgi:diacylglycerol kinase family enzyme
MLEVMTESPPAPVAAEPALFVVINAGSGRGDADAAREQIARVFDEAGRRHAFLPVNPGERIADVAREALRRAQREDGVVVVAGGDGTINAVAQEVYGSGCRFGVLPQGTFNYFAREHGISQETEAAARALLRARPEPVQVGLVNDRVFLVNASVGLYRKLLEDREAAKSQLGRSRVVAMAAGLMTLMREPRQLSLTLEAGDQKRQLRTPSLFLGNNRLQFDRLGLPEGEALERGCLGAILVRAMGTWSILTLALRGALGRLNDADNVVSFPVRRLTVHPHGHQHIKVAADGEVRRMRTPLEFRVAPEPLMLMTPSAEDRVKPE